VIRPLMDYDSGKIEGYKLVIQEMLGTLNALSPLVGEMLDVGEHAPPSAPVDPQDATMNPASVSGVFLSPLCRSYREY